MLLAAAGVVLVAHGLYLVYPPAAYVAGGTLLIWLGVFVIDDGDSA